MSFVKQVLIFGVLALGGCGTDSHDGSDKPATDVGQEAPPAQTPTTPANTPTTPANPPAQPGAQAVRNVEIAVTEGGFGPSPVTIKKGEQVNLVVTRKTDRTCATEIVIPSLSVNKRLPLNTPVTIAITPTAVGTINYSCAMGMYRGALTVE